MALRPARPDHPRSRDINGHGANNYGGEARGSPRHPCGSSEEVMPEIMSMPGAKGNWFHRGKMDELAGQTGGFRSSSDDFSPSPMAAAT